MGAALCSNGNKVITASAVKTSKKAQFNRNNKVGAEADVRDRSSALNGVKVKRDHEKLWRAVENGDLAQAELYLDFNEINEANLYDSLGHTMLHAAAERGSTEIFTLLIERTGSKPDVADQ